MHNTTPAIEKAVEIMRNCFGGTEVSIVSDCYRLEPTKEAPAGALGCDIQLKVPGREMDPIKLFFGNTLAEDIAWPPLEYGEMVANEIVFTVLKPEFEKIKEELGLLNEPL
jgi:hypothetical protein